MYSSTRQPQPSIASSLSAVADTSAAIRRGKLEISAPIPIPTEDLDQLDSRIGDARHRYHSSFSSAKTDTWPRRSTPPTLQDCNRQDRHRNAVLQASCSYSNTSRTSTALTNPHQSMSSLPSGSSVSKSGGIRATFRRLFGSKRRRDTFSTAINDQRSHSASLLNSSGINNQRPLRKPSLLFEELIRGRALNSHAPQVISPEPAEAHSSGIAQIRRFPIDGFGRRNSLPSVVLSSQEAQRLDLTLNHHGNGPDTNALTRSLRRIPNRSFIDSVKRKSRSADALRDVALSQNTQQAQERRLSDEIKYWRNSIIEDPIPSFTSSRQEGREEVEAIQSTSSETPTPTMRDPFKDVPARTPGFNFSGLMLGNVDATVEQRITTVEVKLVDLECAIANLQVSDVEQKVGLGKPPKRREALRDLSQRANARCLSTLAIYPQSSFDSFSTNSSASDDRKNYIGENRNSVANTLRPQKAAATPDISTTVVASSPLPVQPATENEFSRLVVMLSQEQEARRGLESQLKDLQKQINELRFPAAPRGPPTPGHFSTPTSHMIDTSPISTKRYTILPFRTASPRLGLRKTSNKKENEGEETDTDDGFLDVYETPTEAREYGFGLDTPRSPPLVGVM